MTNQEIIESWRYRIFNKSIKQLDIARLSGLGITTVHRVLNGIVADPKASTVDAIESAIQELEEME